VLNKDLIPFLARVKPGDEVALADFPLAPGLRGAVRLARQDVYAQGAVVWRVDPSGMTELPRSRLAFPWGGTDGGSRSRVAFASAIYERDLLVRLRQGTTYLRVSTTSDPWAQSGTGSADIAKLTELKTYWSTNLSGVSRATTILLSGTRSTRG